MGIKKASYKIAEKISDFAGSMTFVYLHTIWFALWFVFKLDINLLTLIVSLEAIYLSTFIMITQNRQEETQEAIIAEVQDEELEQDIDEISEDVDKIELDVDKIEEDVDEIQEDIESMEKQMLLLRKDMAELKKLLQDK